MLRNLMSSTNLPRPRRSRLSSFRGSPLPTQPPPLVAALKSLHSKTVASLTKGCLQAVNQLLHILPSERLEQPTCNGCQTSENLRFALPRDLRATGCGRKIEACRQGHVSASDASLALILGAAGAIGFGKFHLHICRALDVGDADIHPHRKVAFILNVHALKIRQQRGELIWIGQEVVHFFRGARHFEVSTKLNRHGWCSSFSTRPLRSL